MFFQTARKRCANPRAGNGLNPRASLSRSRSYVRLRIFFRRVHLDLSKRTSKSINVPLRYRGRPTKNKNQEGTQRSLFAAPSSLGYVLGVTTRARYSARQGRLGETQSPPGAYKIVFKCLVLRGSDIPLVVIRCSLTLQAIRQAGKD